MTPDRTTHGSCSVTKARVARTRSLVIPEGDGVPSTHTAPTAAPDWKVTPATLGPAPHSFTAPPPTSRRPLIPWWSLLLSTLALATLGAATAVLHLPALIGAIASVCLAGCCLALVVAELAHRATTWRPR